MGRSGYRVLPGVISERNARSLHNCTCRVQLQRHHSFDRNTRKRRLSTTARYVIQYLLSLSFISHWRVVEWLTYLFVPSDTLIVWTEPDGVDYALSFQDPEGCSEVWNFILDVQRHMNSNGTACISMILFIRSNAFHLQPTT